METEALKLPGQDVRKLLAAANGDAALLYLYEQSGLPRAEAMERLRMTQTRYDLAAATLQQMGLWQGGDRSASSPRRRRRTTPKRTSRANTTQDRNSRAWWARRSVGWAASCPRKS